MVSFGFFRLTDTGGRIHPMAQVRQARQLSTEQAAPFSKHRIDDRHAWRAVVDGGAMGRAPTLSARAPRLARIWRGSSDVHRSPGLHAAALAPGRRTSRANCLSLHAREYDGTLMVDRGRRAGGSR